MYCTYKLTVASMKMFLRNRQALFFSLFMPLLILFIFGSINNDKPTKLHLALISHSPSPATAQFIERLRSVDSLVITEGQLDAELAALNKGDRTAVLDIPDDLLSGSSEGSPPALNVYANASRPIEAQTAMIILQRFADQMSLAAVHAQPLFTVKQQSVTAHNSRYIEFLLPGIIAMSIMQMSVFSVAFVFTRYKEQGVLKRLLATPMRPYQFVTANILTRMTMSIVQAALFVVVGVFYFKVQVAGSYWLLTLGVVLGSLMFLGLGFTISGLSKTVETVPVLANIIVFPMLFIGNVLFRSANMPSWLQSISSFLPLTFFAGALRGIMIDGAGPFQIRGDLIGLFVWAVILVTLATLTFRFQDKEGI